MKANFRAFYKVNQKMYDVLTLDIIDKKALIENTDNPKNPLRGYAKLKDITLMQAVGIKDINNKEIYEGDIVKAVGFARWVGVIKYLPKKAAFVLWNFENEPYRDDYVFLSQFEDGFEVLGNTFENSYKDVVRE